MFGFSVRRWHFYESRILSRLDDIEAAIAAQERALALYPEEVVGDRALIQLDRAICIVRSGDINTGLQIAEETLADLPSEHRTDIFVHYGWNAAIAVPARFRNQPSVTEYRDFLRNLAPVNS